MDLKFLRDRRLAIAAAAIVLALAVGLGLIWLEWARGPGPALEASSDVDSLQVEMGSSDPSEALARQVRCFAEGQYVGMLTLSACAERNGVQPGAMDVGIDSEGQASAEVAQGSVAAAPSDTLAASGLPAEAGPPVLAGCWLNTGSWRKLADGVTLDACVQALFSGRCAAPGSAVYGHWADETLRLVPGRVERSNDNRTFQLLALQAPGNCAVQHLAE